MKPKILIFRIGSLGDNLIAMPAISAVLENFPDSELSLLGSRFLGFKYVLGREIFEAAGIFKNFYEYPNPISLNWFWKIFKPILIIKLWLILKREGFETLVYLAPSVRTRKQIVRDRKFFEFVGIKRFIGMDGFQKLPEKIPSKPLPWISSEAEMLLNRLCIAGLKVPPPGRGKIDLAIGKGERTEFDHIIATLSSDLGLNWVGIGPGSNQPAKIWPRENFFKVIERLIQTKDVWPIVLGGNAERELGEWLIAKWGRGYNFAGTLTVRESAVALEKCKIYLGNDTGTMHLAAAVGTPCIAIFSAHAYPGKWYPYGSGHKVFRTAVNCEGCGLSVCIQEKMRCILSITEEEVFRACDSLF